MSSLEWTRSALGGCVRFALILIVLFGMADAGGLRADEPAQQAPSIEAAAATDEAQPPKELFRGQLMRLTDALKEREIRAAEEMESHVVLKTETGELIPILADWRGRALYQDKRLRERDVELVGFRRRGIPYLQVLMIFTFNKEHERQYTDYWCDVCSIPMYEIKLCECCQGPIRLRFQPQDLPEFVAPPDAKERSPAP